MSFSAQYPPVLTEAGDLTSEVLAKYNQEFQYLYTNLLSALFSATTGHAHTGNGSDGAQLTATSIANDAITTLKILNEAVTAAKIADDAVTADKILADAVTTVKILNGAITADKLASDAVTTLKILNAAITTAKFALDAKCPLAGTADKVANALTINGEAYDGSGAKSLTTTAVSITGGTIANGGTIPLPDGYIRGQCKYSVWPHSSTGMVQVNQDTGVVVAQKFDSSIGETGDYVSITAGYMCVGVK